MQRIAPEKMGLGRKLFGGDSNDLCRIDIRQRQQPVQNFRAVQIGNKTMAACAADGKEDMEESA